MSQSASSPLGGASPSVLLALVAAAIVAAYDPKWLSAPVRERARAAGVRPERVSRIKGRVQDALLTLVAGASRRGRKAAQPTGTDGDPPHAAVALLAVATSVLGKLRVSGRDMQDELVAACERLQAAHRVPVRSFCATLAVSERTFRSWRQRPPRSPSTPPPDPGPVPPKPSPPRRGRFALEVFPPGVSAQADTSDWGLFGVPLKIMAVQDPGARGLRTWEAATVTDGEDAQKVVDVVREALADRPGTQLVTDQGSPYLSHAARAAYDEMQLEHAPQKEGNPQGKATLERSFRTVKDALAPLVRLTDKIAEAVPALGRPDFAATVGRLLLGTFLAVDLRARRSTLAGAADPDAFATLAADVRAKARAEDTSIKLTLERIHGAYDMPGSRADFVRRFRGYGVRDVLDAERRMGQKACRCHAQHCDRYFAAIVRAVADESRALRSAESRRALGRIAQERQRAATQALRQHRLDHPEEGLVAGLDRIAVQWDAAHGCFALQRSTPYRDQLRRACEHLFQVDPRAARDRAEVAWKRWAQHNNRLDEDAKRAIRAAFERTLDETLAPTPSSTAELAADILRPNNNRHPPPDPHLRI